MKNNKRTSIFLIAIFSLVFSATASASTYVYTFGQKIQGANEMPAS